VANEPEKSEADQRAEAERLRAKSRFEALLAGVLKLKEMTDTPGWQKVYADLQARIKQHGQDVLNAEKTRDIIAHQEGVKRFREFLADLQAPVGALRNYVSEMPLFASEFHTRAQWSEALGQVELKTFEVKKPK
jgi:hypothetical protein